MLPPPAPIVLTSTIGVRTGYGPIRPSAATAGRPPWTTLTSLLVPPMSSEMKSRTPERSAAKLGPDHAAGRARQEQGHRIAGPRPPPRRSLRATA